MDIIGFLHLPNEGDDVLNGLTVQTSLRRHVSIAPVMAADAKSNRQLEHRVIVVTGSVNTVHQGRAVAGAPS
jgi:hypothetical protein